MDEPSHPTTPPIFTKATWLSLIGGWLSATYGIPTVLDGQAGFIPTPLIFQVAGLATLVALIPLGFVVEQGDQA
jgi:hypothetical protein